MPKRYRPSEKMPDDDLLVIVKLKDKLFNCESARYCKRSTFPWCVYGDDSEDSMSGEYKTEVIDWWLDPMEEDNEKA